MRALSDLVNAHLKRRGWSQAQFARAAGVPVRKMNEFLTGRKRLSRKRLAAAPRWCAALGIDGDEAEQLIDAMHLAAADARVRAIIARLELQSEEGRLAILELEAMKTQLLPDLDAWRRRLRPDGPRRP